MKSLYTLREEQQKALRLALIAEEKAHKSFERRLWLLLLIAIILFGGVILSVWLL